MNKKEKLLNYNMELINDVISHLQKQIREEEQDYLILLNLNNLEQLINDMREDMKLED